MRQMRSLNLVSGEQQYCIWYQLGLESQVLEHICEMISRNDGAFGELEANNMREQLNQHLNRELRDMALERRLTF